MRQKNIKDIDEKLCMHQSMLVSAQPGFWREAFVDGCIDESEAGSLADRALYLEVGTGKGEFISTMAARDEKGLYLGIEGQPSVLYRAIQKAKNVTNCNLKFHYAYIQQPGAIFSPAELSGIYLNFSDPWPKRRHENRRLTSAEYLNGYAEALASGAFLRFKTDDKDFFEYSLNIISASINFDITLVTRDLHNSNYAEENVMTEYERKFLVKGQKINCLIAYRR
jgi:tRNA (guanine-N7-)-methyltransferase